MTSYVLEDHEKRAPVPAAWSDQPHCIFCRIIAGNAPAYRLYENEMVVAILGATSRPATHQQHLPSDPSPSFPRPADPADPNRAARTTLSFARSRSAPDIAPLRPGHTLVIPKTHVSRVSELPDAFAAACGVAVSRLARAVSAGEPPR